MKTFLGQRGATHPPRAPRSATVQFSSCKTSERKTILTYFIFTCLHQDVGISCSIHFNTFEKKTVKCCILVAGMKGSPRFREGTAYIRTKYQPAHIKYPLIAIHSVASVNAYDADNLNVDDRVSSNNTAE